MTDGPPFTRTPRRNTTMTDTTGFFTDEYGELIRGIESIEGILACDEGQLSDRACAALEAALGALKADMADRLAAA
jgi:hypothetical protein